MVVLGERLMAQPSVVLYRFGELILADLHRCGLGLRFLKTGKNGSIAVVLGESGIDSHTYKVRSIGYYYRGNRNPMRQGGFDRPKISQLSLTRLPSFKVHSLGY